MYDIGAEYAKNYQPRNYKHGDYGYNRDEYGMTVDKFCACTHFIAFFSHNFLKVFNLI